MSGRKIIPWSVLAVTMSLSVWAAQNQGGHQHNAHQRGGHETHLDINHSVASSSRRQPREGGQAMFAALVEIVALLEQDTQVD